MRDYYVATLTGLAIYFPRFIVSNNLQNRDIVISKTMIKSRSHLIALNNGVSQKSRPS